MALKIGSTSIGSLYLGSTKISQAYLGSTKVYESSVAPVLPYLVFEFTASDFVPTADPNPDHGVTKSSSYAIGYTSRYGTWTQISASPNRWKWEGWDYSFIDGVYGIPWAFAFQEANTGTLYSQLTSANLGGGTCKIIDCGCFDYVDSNNNTFQSMDRCFGPATALTEFVTMQTPNTLVNLNSVFYGATNVADGALDQYTYWSTYNTNISNHSATFKDCGSNTQTGLADLNQIPVGWGGNAVPASTDMSCARQGSKKPYMLWLCNDTAPDWSTEPSLYVFTTGSVSQYTGVNMKKSAIKNTQNSLATSGAATYYRPAFIQFASGSSGALSWVLTTSGYNGMLDASTSAGDMPGTLDYSVYGPADKHYGAYDSSKSVYFAFLVTNAEPNSWGGLADAYGLQSNSYFITNITIKWFV
jgi:hypothetical protein